MTYRDQRYALLQEVEDLGAEIQLGKAEAERRKGEVERQKGETRKLNLRAGLRVSLFLTGALVGSLTILLCGSWLGSDEPTKLTYVGRTLDTEETCTAQLEESWNGTCFATLECGGRTLYSGSGDCTDGVDEPKFWGSGSPHFLIFSNGRAGVGEGNDVRLLSLRPSPPGEVTNPQRRVP